MSSWPIDRFVVNNLVSIITLCIKLDCPEAWPNAFNDLLQLASDGNVNGLDFVSHIHLIS